MDFSLIQTFLKAILSGDIYAIVISILILIGCIIYFSFILIRIIGTIYKPHNISSQVENSLNLIVDLIKQSEKETRFIITDLNSYLKSHDAKIDTKLGDIERELQFQLTNLEQKINNNLSNNFQQQSAKINNNITNTINTLSTTLDRDIGDFKLNRKELKDSLEVNLKLINSKIDELKNYIKDISYDDEKYHDKIIIALESLKQNFELCRINLMTSTMNLQPFKVSSPQESGDVFKK